MFASRQWSADEWDAARERLVARGWLNADGTATEAGRTGRDSVEAPTDELAGRPWESIGAAEAGRLADPVPSAVLDTIGTGLLPMRSTLGIGMSHPHQG